MSTHKPTQRRFSEEDLESLLFDFFRDEMPAELKTPDEETPAAPRRSPAAPTDRPALHSPRKESQPARDRRTSRTSGTSAAAGLSVAACALLLVVTALMTGNPKTDPGSPETASSQKNSSQTTQPHRAADKPDEPAPHSGKPRTDAAVAATKDETPGRKSSGPRKPAGVLPLEESWVLELLPVEFREYVQQEKPDWWHQLNIDIVHPLPDDPDEDDSDEDDPAKKDRRRTPPRLPEHEHGQ